MCIRDSYDADRIALDGLNYQVIKDSQQALMSYQTGALDMTLLNGEQVDQDVYKRQCQQKATKRHNFSGFPFLLEKVP